MEVGFNISRHCSPEKQSEDTPLARCKAYMEELRRSFSLFPEVKCSSVVPNSETTLACFPHPRRPRCPPSSQHCRPPLPPSPSPYYLSPSALSWCLALAPPSLLFVSDRALLARNRRLPSFSICPIVIKEFREERNREEANPDPCPEKKVLLLLLLLLVCTIERKKEEGRWAYGRTYTE